jgi:hypothetical protein
MSVAKGRRQFVIVDRPAALAGRPADWRETSLRPPLSATEADRRLLGCNPLGRVVGDPPIEPRATDKEEHRALSGVCDSHR